MYFVIVFEKTMNETSNVYTFLFTILCSFKKVTQFLHHLGHILQIFLQIAEPLVSRDVVFLTTFPKNQGSSANMSDVGSIR